MRTFLEGKAVIGRTIEAVAEIDDHRIMLLSGNAYTGFVAYGDYVSLYQSGFEFGGYVSEYDAEKYRDAGLWTEADYQSHIERMKADEARDEAESKRYRERAERAEYKRLKALFEQPPVSNTDTP